MNALLEMLEVVLQYDKDNKNLPAYLTKANALLNPPSKFALCNTCSSLMKRYHYEIQRLVWTRIREEDEAYLPQLPSFISARYNTDYSKKTLTVAPFDDLKANETLCQNEGMKARRMKNPIAEQNCFNDRTALVNYRMTKQNYFTVFLPQLEEKMQQDEEYARLEVQAAIEVQAELDLAKSLEEPKERRNRTIDKEELIKFRAEGLTQKAIAAHFGVSQVAISKMLKEISNG